MHKEYIFIAAYGRLMGHRSAAILRAQYTALRAKQPLDAIHRDSQGNWVRVADVQGSRLWDRLCSTLVSMVLRRL